MPEITPAPKGPALGQLPTEPAVIPADQVKPEDVGTLTLEYRDGVPVLVVSGGTFVPAALTLIDDSGTPVALYGAGPIPQTWQKGTAGMMLWSFFK
ncbi:hypothetical protein ACFYNN_36025 [Streptomyces sp. NPDC006978]|uniref:hypothetical protein n=1 Tax=unclassified Streptomyces TaxID=2593676 RepID=UPI002AFE5B3A|nr:hypothetical protein [Streptomyces sp. S584]